MSFLTAPEWTSTNDSEEQMNFSCQSSGFAGILPFATHPPALAVSGKRVARSACWVLICNTAHIRAYNSDTHQLPRANV